jgi:predicted dienelactone hydrolase
MRWLLALMALGSLAAATFTTWSRAVLMQMPEITVTGSVLPQPAGSFGVGRTTVALPPKDGEPHAVTVDLWYPSASRSPLPPQPTGRIVGGGFNRRARAEAHIDGPVAPLETPFPLLIYAPGWDGPRWDNTFALANLASHGYVVAAVDDVGFSQRGEGRQDLGEFDLASEAAKARSLASANRRLQLMVARISATLDGLAALDRADPKALLSGRVDYSRVGMLGFSFGGSVAAEAALSEPRLVAVANMDGWLFGASATTIIDKPYLAFNSDFPTIETDAESNNVHRRISARMTLSDRAQQRRQAQRPDTVTLLFKQVDHSDFTDDLFSPPLRSYLKRWSRTADDRLRLRATQDAYLLAFFDRHLRGLRTFLPQQSPPPFQGVEFLAPPAPQHR